MSTTGEQRERPTVTLAETKASVGSGPTTSDWVLVDQAMINAFADATMDHAFIHVDPERAQRTRFKGTIAHGLLTLSLLPRLMNAATPLVEGMKMGVNYGFDRVRFVAPVPVDRRVRGHFTLAELIEPKPGFYHFVYDVTVEIEGIERPAMTARWIIGRWF